MYTPLNFEKQVSKNRDKGISLVHFYKFDGRSYIFNNQTYSFIDGKSAKSVKPEFEKFATENKGIFRIGSVDCSEFTKICDKEGIKDFPTIRLYP